ncbi:MAG: hypothetical protein EBW74_10950 [Betaproteobacteria bacterium]|nr:hypothetical protein [Betaproteobacteria bacterium]
MLSSSVTALNASTRTALISITLSEASPSFSDSDVQVVGGSLSGFGGTGTTYTATFTPQENYSGAASLKIGAKSFGDAAGNLNADEVVQALTVDMVAPSVTVVSTDKPGGLKAGESATLTFVVSEGVSDFTDADVVVDGGTAVGTITNFGLWAGGLNQYTATFTPQSNSTSTAAVIRVAGSFRDAAGNPNTAVAPLRVALDTVSPTAVLSSSVTALNASTTALISITLSEASATFDANDLNVLGGTITSFGGTGSTNYTALFTPAVGYTGVGVVEIPVGVFGDAAGNLSTSVYALPLPLTVDTVSPTAVVSTDKPGGLKAGESATLTFTVSEGGVSGFEAADVAVNGVTGSGLITNFGGTGTTYTATFTPTATTMSTARRC